MTGTVGDFLVDRLYEWGVRRIFGYPGDGINGVFGALNRAHGKIEFIQARHEEMAAFMASAHAKFTGELGVCAGHESGHFLVPGLNEFDLAMGAVQRSEYAIDAITRVTKDTPHAPLIQAVHQKVAYSARHCPLLVFGQ